MLGRQVLEPIFGKFPAIVDPEPVGWVASDGGFEGTVDIEHNGAGGAGLAILVGGDFCALLYAPLGQPHPIANAGVKGAIVTQSKDGRRRGGGALVSEEWETNAIIACVLVREQTERNSGLTHKGSKRGGIETAFKEPATRAVPEVLEQTVERRLAETAISGSALVSRGELAKAGVEFEIAEVADGADHGTRRRRRRVGEGWRGEFDAGTKGFEIHGCGFDGASKVFANAAEVFASERANFGGRFFVSQTEGEIAEGDAPMAGVETPNEEAAEPPEPRHELERESLDKDYESVGEEVEHGCYMVS